MGGSSGSMELLWSRREDNYTKYFFGFSLN